MASPPLKPSQQAMLEALLAKRGWSQEDFVRHARKALDALTQAEARQWITRLTKETKGKQHAARRNPPAPAEPIPARTRETPAPAPVTITSALEQIVTALGITDTQRPIIEQRIRAIGPRRALMALERLEHAPTTAPGGWALSPLERWLAACG